MNVHFFDDPRVSGPDAVARAAGALARGEIVAYPTDTFYGLAVDPRRGESIQKLYEVKGRQPDAALTLIAADIEQVERAADLTDLARRLARRWWPGPLTIVVRARAGVHPAALAGGTTVGIRIPDHDVARALARAFGSCLTATSANRSHEPAAHTASAVATALPGVSVILDAGALPGGQPSTLVDATTERVTLIRAGAIAWERVLESVE